MIRNATTARAAIVSLLSEYRTRPTDLVANMATLCATWSIPAFDGTSFGFLSRPAAASVACTSGQPTLTAVAGTWSSGDVGKSVHVAGAAAASATLAATIADVAVGGATCTMSANAATTQAATVAAWGYPVQELDRSPQTQADGDPLAPVFSPLVTATGSITPRYTADRAGDWVNAKDCDVRGDGVTDDTAAIQAMFNANPYKKIWFPYGLYKVTQISITGLGRHIDFDRAIIVGGATTAKTSIVEIKCGLSLIRNLKVAGVQNLNYTCGVHWYTNDTVTHYPGRNRFDGLYVTECKIGLVVGALPDQVDPIPAQGTVQAAGVATDAPLSESYIHGLQTPDCIQGLYFRQPNGKLCLIAPDLVGEDNAWASYSPRSNTCAFTVANAGSELVIMGGDVEQIQQNDGLLFQVSGGQVNMYGVLLEANAPAYMSGTAIVRMHSVTNFGNNNVSRPVFEVDDGAEGILQLRDMRLVLQDGSPQEIVKCTSALGASFSPAHKFRFEADGVEFYNASFAWPTPAVNGCLASMRSCSRTAYTAGVRSALRHIDETDNLLAGSADVSGDQVTAYPQAGSASVAGWAFTVGGGGSTWGKYTTSMPTVEAEAVAAAIRLTTTASTMIAQSAAFPISPKRDMILKAWAKSGATANVIIIRILWLKFDGTTAASTASNDALVGQESAQIGAIWRPLLLRLSPPPDATKAAVFLYAETGADLQIANLSVS